MYIKSWRNLTTFFSMVRKVTRRRGYIDYRVYPTNEYVAFNVKTNKALRSEIEEIEDICSDNSMEIIDRQFDAMIEKGV